MDIILEWEQLEAWKEVMLRLRDREWKAAWRCVVLILMRRAQRPSLTTKPARESAVVPEDGKLHAGSKPLKDF